MSSIRKTIKFIIYEVLPTDFGLTYFVKMNNFHQHTYIQICTSSKYYNANKISSNDYISNIFMNAPTLFTTQV